MVLRPFGRAWCTGPKTSPGGHSNTNVTVAVNGDDKVKDNEWVPVLTEADIAAVELERGSIGEDLGRGRVSIEKP